MKRQKTWFQIQMGQLGLTSEYIAKTLGISRPTLYKIGAMPHRLTVAQLNTLRTLGFAVPGDTSAAPVPNVMPIPCPTCDGTGWLFKPVKAYTDERVREARIDEQRLHNALGDNQ